MEKPETIRSYLDAVALQIRWKRARPVVLHELENHLEDQRAAFEQENAADAERRAVEGVAAILKSAVGTARWFGTGSWETAGYSLGFDQIVPGFGDNAFPRCHALSSRLVSVSGCRLCSRRTDALACVSRLEASDPARQSRHAGRRHHAVRAGCVQPCMESRFSAV